MNDELKAKRDELAEKYSLEAWPIGDAEFEGLFFRADMYPKEFRYEALFAYSEGFDACHEIMQAKLDVAIEALKKACYRHHLDCDDECVDICPVRIKKEALEKLK